MRDATSGIEPRAPQLSRFTILSLELHTYNNNTGGARALEFKIGTGYA
jgi:hypothetical protein